MNVGVPKETASGERRVALVPDVVRKLTSAGHGVTVEAGAGEQALIPDALFTDAGATIGDPWGADVVVKVAPPTPDEAAKLHKGQVLVGFLAPRTAPEVQQEIAKAGATAFAMEAIPRISRAQSMDALSSQANVGGYKAALLGAEHATRFYPMLMTAAGTIPPAKVLVLGVGVAGLQALATARRLGAQTTGYDVRPEVAEQVQSLGAKWLDLGIEAAGEGGYARELTEEERAQQQQALTDAIKGFDVVITTALVPGRPAPKLVTAEAVEGMKPGSVIVDLAGEAGGNCELTEPGEVAVKHDVTIVSPLNLPATMPEHASALYARNVQALLELFTKDDGALAPDFDDEIVKGSCVVRDGEIVKFLDMLVTNLAILVLAGFVGFAVISKVPNTLHTPLMSGTNAIHGIVVLGGIIVLGTADHLDTLSEILLVIAIAFGTINVVGGFLVTDRMLEMFKAKPKPKPAADESKGGGVVILGSSFLHDQNFIDVLYIVAFSLFIYGLMGLTGPRTAVRGNRIAAFGMAIAVVATLLLPGMHRWGLIVVGVVVGTIVGVPAARQVKMTAMPQMVALFNGVGGGAVALIAWVEFRETGGFADVPTYITIFSLFAAIIGSVSFWGSNIAFGKLQEILPGRPITLGRSQQAVNALLLAGAVACGVAIAAGSTDEILMIGLLVFAGILGLFVVLPIGGADMPVVISLLNAFTGLSAAATGVALNNTALIVAGMIVGASGSILTNLMAVAMNRSIPAIIAGGFGGVVTTGGGAGDDGVERTVRSTSAADAAIQMTYANRVVIVPGYGMAVAQAQHAVREMTKLLEEKGIEVSFAIHPVAGRMPGHMNVLLAEADVPYEQLHEMDDANSEFSRTDVSLVIGANDVTNPDAREKTDSPIYGMPILNVDESASVIVLKRSMNSGFAGIDNPLFYNPKTAMLFGDAKASVSEIAEELKAL